MRKLTVLSLFDGISCGQLALQRAGIPVEKYFASEIEKHPIAVAKKNFPDTVHLGDVRAVNGANLPQIDLMIMGPPCQDLSCANNNRKGLEGERSSLFYEAVRLLKECKPKYFLVENVKSMKPADKAIMIKELGVEPIYINSNLLSTQNRARLYFTNIPVALPEPKQINFESVLDLWDRRTDGRGTLVLNENPGIAAVYDAEMKKRGQNYLIVQRDGNIKGKQDKVNVLTTHEVGGGNGYGTNLLYMGNGFLRRFNMTEAERMQTLPDHYTEGTKCRQKSIGNGWTVDVIAHILSGIK